VTETRETFAGLTDWQIVLWYAMIAVSTAVFAAGVALLVRKYRRGRGSWAFDRPLRRVAKAAVVVLTHAWIRRRGGIAGVAHVLVFYGFLVLFAGTAILAFQDDVAEPLLGWTFWEGPFYLGYSLFLDVFGLALLIGLVALVATRLRRPPRLDYARADGGPGDFDRRRYAVGDWVFVGSLFFLGASGFALEALRVAETDPAFERWAPFGWLAAQLLRSLGLDGEAASAAHFGVWWAHGVVALSFVAAIPFTKAVHMLVAPASVAARGEWPGRALDDLPEGATPADVGYGVVADLPPRYLLSLDACT
jgi:hypothetical protein